MTHPRRFQHGRAPVALVGATTFAILLAGCSDDPFAFDWNDTPQTVLLYSLARPELNLASGFSFNRHSRVRIENATATGTWDIALDTQGGQLVLLPPGALGITGSTARIAALSGVTLDDVIEAPADSAAYSTADPVAVTAGTVYVVRTNRAPGSFGSRCVYHAKMEPTVIDIVGGTLTFRYVSSPICNSRSLIPPDD